MFTLTLLLKYNPEVCIVTRSGETPLHYILKSTYHRNEKLKLLLPLLKEGIHWNDMTRDCAPVNCVVACPEDIDLLQLIYNIAPIRTEIIMDVYPLMMSSCVHRTKKVKTTYSRSCNTIYL